MLVITDTLKLHNEIEASWNEIQALNTEWNIMLQFQDEDDDEEDDDFGYEDDDEEDDDFGYEDEDEEDDFNYEDEDEEDEEDE